MKYFKKWTEGDISDIADKDRYKKILQTLEQLDDDELKILMFRYVKLAYYPEGRNALKKPKLEELANSMNLSKAKTQSLLSRAMYKFESLHEREKIVLNQRKRLEEKINNLNSNIDFYKKMIIHCEEKGLSESHPNYQYFVVGLAEYERLLIESKDKLKALLRDVECKN